MFHYQRPEVRQSVKLTTDHHDHHTVEVREHFSDRVDVTARNPRAVLLNPLEYDGRVISPSGRVVPAVRGGAITISGLFGNNMIGTLCPGDTFTSTTRASNGTSTITQLNFVTSHLRCAMFTNSITPNYDDSNLTHISYNGTGGQYAANESSGTGYSAGGAGDSSSSGTFSSPTFTNSSGTLTFNASNAVWTVSTIAHAAGALIYDNSGPGPSSAKSAICFIAFGGDYSTNVGTFTIQWAAAGIWTWSGLG